MPPDATPPPETRALLERFQRNEATAALLYERLAERDVGDADRQVLACIAAEEHEHAAVWRGYTGKDIGPDRFKVWRYSLIARLLGYTFVVKLLEYGEHDDIRAYEAAAADFPEAAGILDQERGHERQLAEMLDEERLRYVGAMVLGLNDALVELTGALAGLTFALGSTRLVALAGLVTGVSATLSMAASNYLAERADGAPDALRSSCYTGAAYLVTVAGLVLPYLLWPADRPWGALLTMLGVALAIIFFFNYYVSVAKSQPFGRRFFEMAGISLAVALLSFGVGYLARQVLGIEM